MEYLSDHDRCLNCLSTMPDGASYCSHCGQKQAGPHDRSVWHLAVDSVGDFFHLDSKFFATLGPMLFRPGFLTTEYLSGRKSRYFHPFKLFLFLSFLYFLTNGILDHRSTEKTGYTGKPSFGVSDSGNALITRRNYNLQINETYTKAINIPDDSLRKMISKYGLNGFVTIRFPNASALSKYMIKKIIINRLEGKMDETMSKTFPRLVFVLILFFAFLLKLLYRKKKIPYFNHVIFSLHFLSFFFMLFIIKALLGILTHWFNPVIVLLLLVYLFFALHRVYPMKWRATAGKFFLFCIGSLFTLLIFIILATTISFMMI